MAFNFKNRTTVGVAVSAEKGLEIAQVDTITKTVLKYGNRPLAFNSLSGEIEDLDIFKEQLEDLLSSLNIPKGSELVFSIPSLIQRIGEYPASLNLEQTKSLIDENLLEETNGTELSFDAAILTTSTLQTNRVLYAAMPKIMLIELAMQVQELGYTLTTIDSSINNILNALVFTERANVAPDVNWVLLLIENSFCRIFSMQGSSFVESHEERISIGEVLGDAENYSTVISTIDPIISKLPSQCLYIISKTDIISAKEIASKIKYNSTIIHQDANIFNDEIILDVTENVDKNVAKMISLDVIGAATRKAANSSLLFDLNLFNESLGDIYLSQQPPVAVIAGKKFILSLENMIIASIVAAIAIIIPTLIICLSIDANLASKQDKLDRIQKNIKKIESFLAENENISTSLFDEGDEIKIGLLRNKGIYSYYTIVGTEIPQKLWLTRLKLGNEITIEGQADNLESIYAFFRNVKDYNQETGIKLQKLGIANSKKLTPLSDDGNINTESVMSLMDADFYEFRISNVAESIEDKTKKASKQQANKSNKKKNRVPIEPLN